MASMIQVPVAMRFRSSSTSMPAALPKVPCSPADSGRALESKFHSNVLMRRPSCTITSTPESRFSAFPRFWADIDVDEDDFVTESSNVYFEDMVGATDDKAEAEANASVCSQSEHGVVCHQASATAAPQQSFVSQQNPAMGDDSYAESDRLFSHNYFHRMNFSAQQSEYQFALQRHRAATGGEAYSMAGSEFYHDNGHHTIFLSPQQEHHSCLIRDRKLASDYSSYITFSKQESDYTPAFQQCNPALGGQSYPMGDTGRFPNYCNIMHFSSTQPEHVRETALDSTVLGAVQISILDSLNDEWKTKSTEGKAVTASSHPGSPPSFISDRTRDADKGDDFNNQSDGFQSTIMLRNVPKKITRNMMLNDLEKRGLLHDINFLNLPVDTRHCGNVGYCFINVVSPEAKDRVVRALHGCTLDSSSVRTCQIVDAKLHGLNANIELFYNSAVLPKLKKHNYPVIIDHGVVKQLPPYTWGDSVPHTICSTMNAA